VIIKGLNLRARAKLTDDACDGAKCWLPQARRCENNVVDAERSAPGMGIA